MTILFIGLTFIGCKKDEVGEIIETTPVDIPYNIEDDCNCGVVKNITYTTTLIQGSGTGGSQYTSYFVVKHFNIENYCSGNMGNFPSIKKSVLASHYFSYEDSETNKYLNKPLCVDNYIIDWQSTQNQSTYQW